MDSARMLTQRFWLHQFSPGDQVEIPADIYYSKISKKTFEDWGCQEMLSARVVSVWPHFLEVKPAGRGTKTLTLTPWECSKVTKKYIQKANAAKEMHDLIQVMRRGADRK